MFDRQRLSRHARECVLIFAWIFLVIGLAGYDPADPPGSSASPANSPPTNPCGPVGAALASGLQQSFGHASWVAAWALAVATLATIRRRPIPDAPAVGLGLTLLAAVASGVIGHFALGSATGPPIGPGGYVGAALVTLIRGQFGLAGMFLILAAVALGGLALAGEAALAWPAREIAGLVRLGRNARRPAEIPAGSPDLNVPLILPAERYEGGPRLNGPLPRPSLGRATVAIGDGAASAGPPAVRRDRASNAVVQAPGDGSYMLPPLEMLEPSPSFPIQDHEAKIHARAVLLERTLLEFGYQVRVVQIDTGPVITQFEIELEAGLRVSRIRELGDDLAIALAVSSVRIVAPIPGKTTVGIEVPNERRGIVKLGEVANAVEANRTKYRIPLYLGKDVKGAPLVFDLADMPHLLIAGRTGTGKSVCLNAMILSILMTKRPDEVKMILIDPKMVELSQFKKIPHLMHPVVTDMKKAESLLAWACDQMDERYGYLARAGVRNLQGYNELGAEEIYERLRPEDEEERKRIPTHMPYIVIIADEMADLMMTAAKEVESHIVRLAQKARAVGMHLIVATQKPTVDVITGLIKGNLPARIAFQVASKTDSRVVLDEMGADKLLGNGDMLFLFPGTSHIVRAQGTYVSDVEVTRVCDFLAQYPVEFSKELVQLQVGGGPGGKDRGAALKERDDLYEPAIEVIIREGRGSCSLLQRALGIGYGRAARLIDFMAEDGIVGEFKSGSAREVLYTWDEWETLKNGGQAPGTAA